MRKAKGKNRYCGPYALSVMTGVTTDEAAKRIREKYRGWGSRVRGTYHGEIGYVLRTEGKSMNRVNGFPKGTRLGRWMETVTGRGRSYYLIEVPGHWVVVQGSKVTCAEDRRIVSVTEHKHRRSVVKRAWRIGKHQHPIKHAIDDRCRSLESLFF